MQMNGGGKEKSNWRSFDFHLNFHSEGNVLSECSTKHNLRTTALYVVIHMGADKSLARPGRKQATVTGDFDFHISYL